MQAHDATATREPNERPRLEERVRIRVRLRPGANSAALPGVQVRRRCIDARGRQVGNSSTGVAADDSGSQELIVYASDAQRIADTKVETRLDMFEQARATFHKGLSEYVRGRQMQADVMRGKPPRELPMERDEWSDDEKRYAMGYQGSPEAVFRVIMSRSVRPLESIEILEHLDAPVMPEAQSAAQAADILRRVITPAQSSDSAELAEMRKQMAEMKALLAEATKPSKKNQPQQ